MRLIEALRVANSPAPPDAQPFIVGLACSFTPLHLETMVKASLRLALPGRRVEVRTGLYGDLVGTLDGLKPADVDAVAVFLEWPDVDPRLGLRQLGGWGGDGRDEILREARARLPRLALALETLSARVPVALSMPSLPLPPIGVNRTTEASVFELQVQSLAAAWAADLAARSTVTILNQRELDRRSPGAERHDLQSELLTGFPYTLAHASVLGTLASRLMAPPAPVKGIVTDLDDTVWQGLVGEDGPDGVSWDLDHKSHIHAVYQQFLRSAAESGVLVAVASKNELSLVEQVLDRQDIHLRRRDVYPFEVNWQPKSASIAQILTTWNISAESVVFIDDTAMELDEVKTAHPAITCELFPKDDVAAVYALIHRLRDMCGKRHVTEEDRIRAASIRTSTQQHSLAAGAASMDAFLERSEARVAFSYAKSPPDPRVLELINKTNQFNLNGRRFNDAEWARYRDRDDTSVLVVSYDDKFGPLGKIAVLAGRKAGPSFTVDSWVMSCRAFSRRIEHQTVREVLQEFDVEAVELSFVATERNGPVRDFLESVSGAPPDGPVKLSRLHFEQHCPALYHRLERTR